MTRFSRKRIAPIESSSDIIEIRPSRYLRIQHHNARPRDEQFNREMETFMQYNKTGIPSSGPLIMSKRLTNKSPYNLPESPAITSSHSVKDGEGTIVNSNQVVNKHETNHEQDNPLEPVKDKYSFNEDIASSYVNPSVSSSVLSSPSLSKNVSDKIQSASSVLVALHSQNHSQKDQQTSKSDVEIVESKSYDPLFTKTLNKNSIPSEQYHEKPICDLKTSPSKQQYEGTLSHSYGHDSDGGNQSESLKNISKSQDISDIVIFFIHGVGGCSDIWYAQIHHFAQKGYEIVAPDLIGHGYSSCPKNAKAYHFKEIAADIERIFDKYCKKRNVVVGHSYGGSFATFLARTRSRHVHKLVLISSGPPTPLAPQPGVFTLPTCLLGCIKPCLVCGFKKGAFHKKRKPVIPKEHAFAIPTIVLQHMMNGQDWPDGDELYHNWLTCPCLLIYGIDDSLVSLQDELDTQKAIFDSHLEVVKDASHMVMMEAPNEVNELLADFIEQNSSHSNQDHQGSNIPESVKLTSSFKRQKSLITLKSHVQQKS